MGGMCIAADQQRPAPLHPVRRAPHAFSRQAQGSFVDDAMNVVRANFMALEPDLLDFSLLALASTQ